MSKKDIKEKEDGPIKKINTKMGMGATWPVVVFILVLVGIALVSAWKIIDTDVEKVTKINSSCTTVVSPNGSIQYVDAETKEPVTTEQRVSDLSTVLKEYIDGTDEEINERIEYLMGAEAVTKMPYISEEEKEEAGVGAGENGEDILGETDLVGQIKFYRFLEGATITAEDLKAKEDANEEVDLKAELTEENRLKFTSNENFQKMLQEYKEGKDPEGEKLFKHFTLDENGSVIIAYGSVEERYIFTGGEKGGGGATDFELTADIVSEKSGETYSGNPANGFSMKRYTAYTKTIDYLSLVEPYIMPSNLLYSFLIETKDIKFTEAIADLAYTSEIAIGIYDNNTEKTTEEIYKYKKVMEIDVITGINLQSISTAEPNMPKVTGSTIANKYPAIPIQCQLATLKNDEKRILKHRAPSSNYGNKGKNGDWNEIDNTIYIKNVNSNKQVTNLVLEENANQFSIKYNQKINSKSTPTAGVVLADTWVAEFSAIYLREDGDSGSPANTATLPEATIEKYEDEENKILTTFANKGDIEEELKKHAEELKQNAIKIFMENTDFSVPVGNVAVSTQERKGILNNHIKNCTVCTDIVKINGLEGATIDKIYTETTSESGVLYNSKVKQHYDEKLEKYKKDKEQAAKDFAKQKENSRKVNFEKALNEQITYSYKVKGEKFNTNINYTASSTTEFSTHKKAETLGISKEGERFSKVFNDDDFQETKEAFLIRAEWFFMDMKKDPSTEKIEDILRYLLNTATRSKKFGSFKEEQIANLFKVFEPQQLMTVNPMYGGSIETKVWFALINEGYSKEAAAGAMGNFYAESGFKTNNLENSFASKLGYTDEEYTEAVNNGTYTREQFISDHTSKNCGAGYRTGTMDIWH